MTENAFTKALIELQANLPAIRKENTADTGKFKYSYADLTDVSDKIIPLLGQHGFTWTTAPTINDHGFVLHYELRHITGEAISGDYPLPTAAPQEIGSAVTYARRYALCAVTGVAPGGDDDDAGKAQRSYTPKPSREAGAVRVATQKLSAATSLDELRTTWDGLNPQVRADPAVVAAKDARKQVLEAPVAASWDAIEVKP